MAILRGVLNAFIWPGDVFCARLGASPNEDSGMLRGFVNSIVWGLVAVIVMWQVV